MKAYLVVSPRYASLPPHPLCVADGRLALNLGTLVMVYHPRTNAGELYNFSSSSVACPGPDQQIIDLQRYPGKVSEREQQWTGRSRMRELMESIFE